ncbi:MULTISPECIES: MFS transporter [unclassified Herbaspirillum]|uniref:MFS transporter n=1 Tax=unclassified Herbaspirillum TaxID=2624150 RepID=UPI0011524EAB|nr:MULTISPECIES: MFS transporter [unclassified Herbaspirillum]MBB5391756.1 MFS family permease [Herbaspirillum sp. SJZ102]TQK02998.1 MFS transporter [Herbaspirillum sp. SJZ130]TQK06614.1 MFS transporter [Herbaspirillum sp. SJZ106]
MTTNSSSSSTEAALQSPEPAGRTASWGELLNARNAPRAVALTGGVALHAINVHIVTTILPSVVRDIGGLDYYAWNVTLFVAASIIGSTLTGKLLSTLGARRTYLLGLAVFGAGALVCAAAGSMMWMLAGRAVQGIGGGLLAALGYALIPLVFEQRLWSRAIALVSGMWGISTLLGPAVGGLFAASGHWRLAFWALMPLLLLQAILVTTQLGPRSVKTDNTQDNAMPLGRILLLAVSVLLVALAAQADAGWKAAACVAGGALLGLLVVRIDLRHRISLLPRSGYALSSDMGKVFACVSLLVIGSCTEIFVPYFLQVLHGYQPLAAGYMTAAMAGGWSIGSLTSSGRSGAAADRMVRIGPMLMALGLMALALLLPGRLLAASLVADVGIVLALAAAGMGIGLGWPHLIARALHAAKPGEENLTSSAVTTVQLYAMAMGAALVGLTANEAGLTVPGGVAGAQEAAAVLFAVFALAPALAVQLARRLTRTLKPLKSLEQ